MGLTPEEKKEWVLYLLRGSRINNGFLGSFGRNLTPEYLEEMGKKTDEEVRVILAEYKQQKINDLLAKKAKIEEQISELS